MTEQATISKLVVRNFRGIKALEVHPGSLNVIAADNAEGKTSLLEAIAAGLRGKVPASAIRHDEEKAEITIEMSDGTAVHRRIKADGKSTVKVERDRAIIKAPQKYLDGLFAPEGLDPVAFLREQKDRSQVLLEALPLETTMAEVKEYLKAAGLKTSDVAGLRTESTHAFEVFDAVRKRLYESRRDVNKEAKQLEQWLAQERKPLADMNDPSERLEEVQRQLGELAGKEQAAMEVAAMELKKQEALKFQVSAVKQAKAAYDAADEALSAAERARGDAISALNREQARLKEQEQELAEARQALVEIDTGVLIKQRGLLDDEADHLREARALWEAAQRREGELAAKEQELEAMKARSEALTQGVDTFGKTAPQQTLARTEMPVDGLEYLDGAFSWNGTHVDQLSGKETILLASRLTRKLLESQRLAVLCLDGFEAIGPNHLKAFFDEIKGDGIQYWIAWVDHGQSPPEGEDVLYLVLKDGAPEGQEAEPVPEGEDAQVDKQAGMAF